MAKKQLQEMEASSAKQSKTAVNANAKPAMPMDTSVAGSVEDLGGPTPYNYKSDDDSAKLKTPGASLKQVKDVVNKGAKPADPMKGMKENEEVSDEVIEEEEVATDEVVAETAVEETPEVDIEEDVNALFGGEDLSEEFKEKAKLVFETALNSKVSEVKEALEAKYSETLEERIDAYLEYVADEWMSENQLAVEAGLKTEMTESFLTGMKGLFEEHYVTIPEEKYDVLNNMVDKLDEMEGKLNEQINKNVALTKRLSESTSDVIFADVTEGLAVTQKDKLAKLVENVEFDSEDKYREKLVTLRESYFPTNGSNVQRNETETLTEGTETGHQQPAVSGMMESYLQALSKVSKKRLLYHKFKLNF